MRAPAETRVKMGANPRRAYKLLRRRADGTLGPLFIDRGKDMLLGRWYTAEDIPTKGYAHRPGWHSLQAPVAPHLKMQLKNGEMREWFAVGIEDYETFERPASQGGIWFLSKKIILLYKCERRKT